jgi:hypothetical protein
VVFRVDFYNDFVPGGMTAQLFRATIEVLGRGRTVVDTRPVFIVVPAQGSVLLRCTSAMMVCEVAPR